MFFHGSRHLTKLGFCPRAKPTSKPHKGSCPQGHLVVGDSNSDLKKHESRPIWLHVRGLYYLHTYLPAHPCLHTALQRSMSSTATIGPLSNSLPDPVWAESTLVPQPAPVRRSAPVAGQSIAELAKICREQAEELEGGPLAGNQTCGALLHLSFTCIQWSPAAKEVIINHLKRKVTNLEAAALTQPSHTPENHAPSNVQQMQAGSR